MGSIQPGRPVRIGNAMGAVTDLPENIANLAKRTDIDFIVGDWMSEYNMSSRGSLKMARIDKPEADGEAAYEVNFLESIEPALPDIAKNGIRIAVNAGASDTQKLYEKLAELISDTQLDLKIAWVEGDEVFEAVSKCRSEGTEFRNITTGALWLHSKTVLC